MKMENSEEIFQSLDDFSKRKPKTIPRELEEYLGYVARTGDPVYQWAVVKCLFKEKLLNVITDFYETSPGLDIPHCPNVDAFSYDTMKNSLIEKIESFHSAPFTVQRICELLTAPRKQYNRIDKFMRAIEKNVLVVSTREPGTQRHIEQENGEQIEAMVNGSDNSDYNVDVEMEDVSWKDNLDLQQNTQPQASSSETHITVDDIVPTAPIAQESPIEAEEKDTAQSVSVTPIEHDVPVEDIPMVTSDEQSDSKVDESPLITKEKQASSSDTEITVDDLEDSTPSNVDTTPIPQESQAEIKEEPVQSESTSLSPTPELNIPSEKTEEPIIKPDEQNLSSIDDSPVIEEEKPQETMKLQVTEENSESTSPVTQENPSEASSDKHADIQYESVTPPEPIVPSEEPIVPPTVKPDEEMSSAVDIPMAQDEEKENVEVTSEECSN